MELSEAVGALVRQLREWNQDLDRLGADGRRHPRAARARAALAHLRHGLGKPPGEAPEALGYVLPFVTERAGDRLVDTLYLVATLFAGHRLLSDAERRNMGHVFREMEKREQPDTPADAGERRFVALLRARGDSVARHLRHAVDLAASQRVPINYFRLTFDLLNWDDPARGDRVRRNWARAYWGHHHDTATPSGEETE